jgi:hypothetical protein
MEDYKVAVTFNDGKRGIVDLSAILCGPVFAPLQDRSMFMRFRLDEELHTIVWLNGADLAPEYLYFLAFADDPSLRRQFKKWDYTA